MSFFVIFLGKTAGFFPIQKRQCFENSAGLGLDPPLFGFHLIKLLLFQKKTCNE
jgi:hypothetical protein